MLRSAAAQVWRELKDVAQPFEVHQRLAVIIRPAWFDRLVGDIVRDQRRLAGEGQNQEFGVAVLVRPARAIRPAPSRYRPA